MLDTRDREILKALEDDGRALITEIAKKTGIPHDTVNYRIRKMRENGVIKAFVPICDTNKMGKPIYTWVNMQLRKFDEQIEARFQAFLRGNENVVYIGRVTGHYHYIITLATKTVQDFDIFMRLMHSKFPDLIADYNSSLLIDEIQYDSFYKLIDKEEDSGRKK